MARSLILDTNTVIAYERQEFDITRLDDDDLAIAAITVTEYRFGIELADSADRAQQRASALNRIIGTIDVLPYTTTTAAHHARLLAHVRRVGRPRSAHDLFIAAHAAEGRRTVLGRDARARFGDLPGVDYLSLNEL